MSVHKAGVRLDGVAWRTLGTACACLLFAVRAVAVPAAPASLLATPANARVTVTWGPVSGATSYNVYRSLTPGGPYGSPLASGLTAASYTDNAVTNGTTYYYAATAVDGTGEGPRSAEDPATPRAGTFVSGLIGGLSASTTTWTPAGSPYVVVGSVEVRGNENSGTDRTSTLVIQSGVTVLFEPGTGLSVGDDTGFNGGHSGRLQATGATFISNRNDPQPGDWRGIRFGNTAVDGGANNFLSGCTVEGAGGAGTAAAVEVNLSRPELRSGTVVRRTASGGVHVSTGAAITISDSEIEGATAPAVLVLGSSSLGLTGTRLRGGPYPVRIQPNVVLTALSGNTAEGYAADRDGIAVEGGVMGGNVSQSRTWPGADLPYIVLGDLAVRGTENSGTDRTSTLIIGPSATVRFAAGTGLSAGDDTSFGGGHWGNLQATGVSFTANSTVPTPGFWKGIYFADQARDGVTTDFLEDCSVLWAGGGANGAVVVNLSSPGLRNVRILGTATAGVHMTSASATTLSITGSEIEGGSGAAVRALDRARLTLTGTRLRGGAYPLHIQPNVELLALSGNSMEGYAFEQAAVAVEGGVMGGNVGQSRTWPGGDLPYLVLANLEVRGTENSGTDRTSTLIIGPSTVRFAAGTGLSVGDDTSFGGGHWGTLQARGVGFTANSTAPAPGFWKGIYFADQARDGATTDFLEDCSVLWAGGSGASGAVAVNLSSPGLRNVRILGTATVGVSMTSGAATSVSITGGEIEGGSGPAVQALGRSTLSLTGIHLRGGSYPVRIQPNVILAALSGNTAEGYAADRDGIAVEGGVMGDNTSQSRTWPGTDLPYIVLGDLSVRGTEDSGTDRTSTLVIGSPAIVRFAAAAGLFVGDDTPFGGGHWGRLQAVGVTFTANTTAPAAGFWKGIYFANQARDGATADFLEDCSVQWAGGGGANGAVVVNQSSPGLRNVRVLGTATAGVYMTAGSATTLSITGSEIEGGSGAAVRVLDRARLTLTGTRLRGGTYPLHIQPNVELLALSGNILEGYAFEQAAAAVDGGVMGGNVSQSRTWPGGDLPYLVLASLEVRGTENSGTDRTSTLVVGPSVEMRFAAGAGFFVGDDSSFGGGHWGRLQATGVTFTANTPVPAPGFWLGISFGRTARGDGESFLDACVVEAAGGTGSTAAVAVDEISLILRNGTAVRSVGNIGLHLSGDGTSSAIVTGGEIEGGSGPAVQALGRSTLSLTGALLRGGSYPVRIQPNVVLAALGSNTAEGYPADRDGIAVEGGVMGGNAIQSRTWPGGDLPYIVLGDLAVRGTENSGTDRTSTLVIGSPATVRFAAGTGLSVGDDTSFDGGHWGRLQAVGVTFTASSSAPVAGSWKGIYFADQTRDGESFLEDCSVRWAGGGGASGAVVVNQTSPGLRSVKVLGTATAGVYMAAGTASASITDSEVEGGSDAAVRVFDRARLTLTGNRLRGGAYPVRIQPNVELLALGGNVMEGYALEQAGIAVEGGVMGGNAAQSRTWPGGDLPYIVLGDLSVRGTENSGNDRTSTLVIGSPARVRFAAGAGLFVGDDTSIDGGHWGRLQATGVTFTAATATPVPGWWKGIYFADQALDGGANSFLDGCTVDWAGGEVAGAVRVNASAPVFKNGLAVRNTATAGVHLSPSPATNASILGGEIEGGADAAVRAMGSSTLLLRDVTLRGGIYPVRIDPNVTLLGLRGSRAEGYPFERSAVAVEGGLMGSSGGPQTRVWPAADLPFLVLGEVHVRGNQNTGSDRTSTLMLQSGGEVRFGRGASLQIGDDTNIDGGHWGVLQASDVTFTANTLSPDPGFWNGIYFADQTRDDLSFLFDCTVEHGGAGGNVVLYRSSPYLSGVVVLGSSESGVLATFSDAVLTGSRLTGNPDGLRLLFSSGALSLADSDVEGSSRFGVFNGAPSSLFARFNWWGDPSGPRAASNPGGLGDRVSDRVDFAPWLTASPLPPVAPVGVTARPGDGTVALAWSANPEKDVAGYNVYRRLPPATAWTLRSPSPVPSFQDAGLTNRIGHCYQVRTVDGQGKEGDPSREACATPKADVMPPSWAGPTGALFAEGSDGQAVVRFEPAADQGPAAAYNLYYSTFSPVDRGLPGTGRIANAVVTPSGSGHALEVSVPGLINGRRYFFNVQAVDAEGNEDGNNAEATAVIGAGSGAVLAASPWTGAMFDGVEIDSQGRAVLAAGRTEGQITSAVIELPAGADLSAIAWNAVQPAGTAVDTVSGGTPTIEVRAAESAATLANARCTAPTELAAWWPGDGNGRDIQAGQDGAVRGGTGFAAGRSAAAFRFDGNDDRVEGPNFGSFTRVTVQAWVYREGGTSTRESLVSYKESGGCGFVLSLNEDGASQRPRLFVQVNGTWRFAEGALPVPLERWTHLTGTYDGQEIRLYVDGALAAATPAVGNMVQCSQRVGLGARSSFDQHFFPGRLDEVAIFSRALTEAEIQALYAAGGAGLCKPDADGDGVADLGDACPATPGHAPVDAAGCPGGCFGPPANRVSWWRGEGDAADSAGTSSGTLAGGTAFDLGQVGQAFRFDGVDDRVELPNFGSFNRVTVQTWVYREGATNTRESVVSYKESDPHCGFVLSLNEDGVSQLPRMFVQVNGIWLFTEGTLPVPFARWTHLAGSYDGQTIRLYVNGVLAAATPAAGSMTQCNQKAAIGSRASFNRDYFPGRVDEVTIFDRALSPGEVQALAEAGSAGMCVTAPPPSGAPAGAPQIEQGWMQVAPNQALDLPEGRYVQVRVTLRGDGTQSPSLRSVSLGYRGGG